MTIADSLKSELLSAAGFRHAFFTRRGGVSESPFASLNFSISVGDQPSCVAENLRRAGLALDIDPANLYFASQVHGCQTLLIQGRPDPGEILHSEADALVGTEPGIACAIRSADCVPILLADLQTGAVAAIHAGWRGVVREVIARGVERLRSALGGPGDLIAAIGPHISVAAFEVSEGVADQLQRASPTSEVLDRSGRRPRANLRTIVRAQLVSLGLGRDSIDDVLGCTFGDPERFFSFRRDGKQSGRHLSAIVPQERAAPPMRPRAS